MSTTPDREQRDILALLAGELQEQLDANLDGDPEAESPEQRAGRVGNELENFEHAAQLTGLAGLEGVCAALLRQTAVLADTATIELAEPLLSAWPMYLLDYVQQLDAGEPDPGAVDALLDFLQETDWPQPIDTDERTQLRTALLSPDWALPERDGTEPPDLPQTAEPAMLDLSPGEEVNPQLFEGLMLELPGQIQRLADSLDRFAREADTEALVQAQRIAHTVKGSANVVGVAGLANFMHYSEDLLERLGRAAPEARERWQDLPMEMADTAAALHEHLEADSQPGDEELACLQRLLDAYHQLDENAPAETAPAPPAAAPEPHTDEPAPSPVETRTEPAQTSEPAQVRVDEPRLQSLLTQAGEASIGNHRLNTQSRATRSQLHGLNQLQRKLGGLIDELGQLIEVRNLFGAEDDPEHTDLDPLELDRYNELHSFYHQLQEYAADADDLVQAGRQSLSELDELILAQSRNHRSSQEEVLSMLSLPASTLESRLQRCVRQACRQTGKRAQLTLSGGETRLDRQTLQQLADPLMHLLRNAVDHGIEEAQVRAEQGKPEQGQLTLSIRPEGQSTRLVLTDDGAGLDTGQIVERARQLGLEVPDEPEAQWLEQTLFSPGFSTREAVTQTSGRGIGLDAVAQQVRELHGQIQLDSDAGGGTRWQLTLPNRLVAEHQLLVQMGEHQMALSSRGVQQVLFVEPEQLSNRGERLYYRHGDRSLPVWHLAQVAPLTEAPSADTREARALLLVETGERDAPAGLLVDRILASREMVIKPLPRHTPDLPGLLGATILGDGRVAPVADTRTLLERATERPQAAQPISSQHRAPPQRPLALIVDDSLSTRRSLSEFVTELGMDVATARDGFEAIERLRERRPSLVLVDMEMPRMNGLELTAHLKAQQALQDIPVIMITSRNTDKHRELADAAGVDAYLNKPFSEDELLHSIEGRSH